MVILDAPDLVDGPALEAELRAAGFADVAVSVSFRGGDTDPPQLQRVVEVAGFDSSRVELGESHADAVGAVLAAHDPWMVVADRGSFPADGVAEAVVVYRRRSLPAGAVVVFYVNGERFDVVAEPEGGRAVVEVSATAAGPVVVAVGGRSLTLEAY